MDRLDPHPSSSHRTYIHYVQSGGPDAALLPVWEAALQLLAASSPGDGKPHAYFAACLLRRCVGGWWGEGWRGSDGEGDMCHSVLYVSH